MTSEPNPEIPGEFQEDLQKFHLSQVIADRYQKNPQKLGDHYDLNFTPSPPRDASGEDPAEDSVFMIISEKSEYRTSNFGNLLNPQDQRGNYNCINKH